MSLIVGIYLGFNASSLYLGEGGAATEQDAERSQQQSIYQMVNFSHKNNPTKETLDDF